MSNQVIHIGMDLGSSKTAVACSNGRRDVMPTAVGWPKDRFARSVLGRDMIFGKDIEDHYKILDVIRPFEKGLLKYADGNKVGITDDQIQQHVNAAKLIVERAVSMMEPPSGTPIYGVIGAPSRASIANKQIFVEASQDAFDSVAIVSEPFTVAYGMNIMSDAIVVDIGGGTIDICPIYGMTPSDEEQVTVSAGGDLVDEDFHMRINDMYPDVQCSRHLARDIKEQYGFVHEFNESVVVTLSVAGRPRQLDVAKPLKEACMTLVDPIIRGLEEVVSTLAPGYKERMLQNVILAGGGSQLNGLCRLVEDSMDEFGGAKVSKVYDSVFAGAVGALNLASEMSETNWQEIMAAGEDPRDDSHRDPSIHIASFEIEQHQNAAA